MVTGAVIIAKRARSPSTIVAIPFICSFTTRMLKQPQLTDDLFEKSSMSFGEHLEELRKALFKAILWLGLGTLVGLLFANTVVNFVSQPLRKKMDVFYVKQSAAKFKAINGQEAPEALLAWMRNNSVMPELIFVNPDQLRSVGAAGQGEGTSTKKDEAGTTQPASTTEVPKATDPKTSDAKPDEAKTPTPADYKSVWSGLKGDVITQLRPMLIMRPIPNRLSTFDALEGFLIWLKAGLLVGATIASPGIFWHVWQFLAAGLYPHERKYVYIYLPLSVILFVSGVCLAFFVIFELVIEFLLTYNEGMDIDFAPRLKDYISFALFLPLGFGIAFQLPIVMLGLNRFGVIPLDLYVKHWRIAILAIAFISMILTPADAYSMIGMFIPLTILYFLGIALCKYMPQGPGLGSQAFDPS